jgi:hypothetical protein
VKVARKRFAVIITFRKYDKSPPVLQQMLKMLASCMYALSTTAEDIDYSLEFTSSC